MGEKLNYGTAKNEENLVEVPEELYKTEPKRKVRVKTDTVEAEPEFINCLRNEKVIVRYINNFDNGITNPAHIYYGGLADGAVISYVTPKLRNGKFANVLTDSEMAFLEHYMGLEKGALSIYRKMDNFWSDANPDGLGTIDLSKNDTFLDLNDPIDYIKYKVLLSLKNVIAPSEEAYEARPLPTYRFVLIRESEQNNFKLTKADLKEKCFAAYSKIKLKADIMRTVIELLDGRPQSSETKITFLQNKAAEWIDKDPSKFLRIVEDEKLDTKVLLRLAVEDGIVIKRGSQYMLREGNEPMCEINQEPTFNMAVNYLLNPKHSEVRSIIEARVYNK